MTRTPWFFASALTAALSLTAPAYSQVTADTGLQALSLRLFFSPSGQPFRGKTGEPYPSAAWFTQADADHDGKISHDEFVADATRVFNLIDTNHDHSINGPENTRYETEIAPEITRIDPRITQPTRYENDKPDSSDPDPRLGKYVKTVQGASQYSFLDEPQPVRAADANFDFKVTGQEWLNATDKRFEQLDRNGDGVLTADEFPKTPAEQAFDTLQRKKGADGKKKLFGF